MKIEKIEKVRPGIYEVFFIPNWFEKLFGVKPASKKYKKKPFTSYTFGSGNVWVDQKGKELGNGNWIGEALDSFLNSWT